MEFLTVLEKPAAAITSAWSWLLVFGVLAALVAWNGGRNLRSAALFAGSVMPALLVVDLIQYAIVSAAPTPGLWITVLGVKALCVSVLLLAACGLVTGTSLVVRTPLPQVERVVTLLVLACAPVLLIALALLGAQIYFALDEF